MHISQLHVENFRNLDNQIVKLSPQINLITGGNGAGKTSLLEAIYFLGRQKSFRTTKIKELIQKDNNYFRLIAKIHNPDHQIGLERKLDKHHLVLQCRIDKQHQKSPTELIKIIPTIAITAQSFHLISSGPSFRRAFMDYGAFHFEARFFKHWQAYQKALKNRNSAFKQKMERSVIESFTPTLVAHGEVINQIREHYFENFKSLLNKHLECLEFPFAIIVRYHCGWNITESLHKALHKNFENDSRLHHTRLGPHRADISFVIDGGNAENRLSRGQQKILILAMYLAQIDVIGKFGASSPLLIFDDIAAEFDASRRNQILDYLSRLNCQMFFSTTEPEFFETNTRNKASLISLKEGKII